MAGAAPISRPLAAKSFTSPQPTPPRLSRFTRARKPPVRREPPSRFIREGADPAASEIQDSSKIRTWMPSGIYICRASINAAVMRIPENMHIMAEPIPGPFDRRHRMKADADIVWKQGPCNTGTGPLGITRTEREPYRKKPAHGRRQNSGNARLRNFGFQVCAGYRHSENCLSLRRTVRKILNR